MEIAEKIQHEAGTPAPATPATTAKVEASVPASAPAVVDHTAEMLKKQTAAFIKMRQEKRELKQQLATAQANTATPPAAPADPAQVAKPENQTVPVPAKTARDIEAESVRAIEAIAAERDVASVPGALMDIIHMVDTVQELSDLHAVSPSLAFREAKAIWASKAGIGATPVMPISSTTSGGMSTEVTNLDSLVAACEKEKPGTKEFNILAKKIRAILIPIS
jgi:hypothetical protein